LRHILAIMVGLLILGCLSARADTKQTDRCSTFRSNAAKVSRSRLDLDEAAAVEIAKHIQKACKVITEVQSVSVLVSSPKFAEVLTDTGKRLTGVLDRIYRAHPTLRGKDLTELASVQAKKLPVKPCIGRGAAIRLRWRFANIESAYAKVQAVTPCKADEAGCSKLIDLVSEVGFAASPIYNAYPDLWHLQMHEVLKQVRTEKSDDGFRKVAPKPGSVRLTSAASSRVRELMESLKKEGGLGCQVATLSWTPFSESKGPEDKDWKKSGPSVGAGAFGCDQIPPDAIRNVDGLRIVFEGDSAQRFEGKTVDFQKGHFLLEGK
jgi:Fe-S cluster assembly iron-binding protein IscA